MKPKLMVSGKSKKTGKNFEFFTTSWNHAWEVFYRHTKCKIDRLDQQWFHQKGYH